MPALDGAAFKTMDGYSKETDNSGKKSKEQNVIVPKTAIALQKMKLERLMENPEKPIVIPDRPKDKKTITPPEFVRNVMGSSAGAGSGEFHVYRHLRRKEYARQKCIDEKGLKERLDEEFHQKLEENKRRTEDRTAKKRLKRQKFKEKKKANRKGNVQNQDKNELEKENTSDSENDEDNNEVDSNAN